MLHVLSRGLTLWVAAALFSATATAGDFTVTATGVSEYDFRGISQSQGAAPLQVSVNYEQQGFYATAWGSSVDFGDKVDGSLEIDLTAGFARETSTGVRLDAGAVLYAYPGSSENLQDLQDSSDDIAASADYVELFVGAGYGRVDAKYWHSPNLYDSGETAAYLETVASFGLPAELELHLHAGYSFGDYFDSLGSPGGDDAEYFDYSIGISRSVKRFDLEVRYIWTDTDPEFQVPRGAFRNDDRVVVAVSTTFPWARAERNVP